MSASVESEGVEPNLTPILDMVFQLITFFMLVINFKGASMDMTLKLPVLGSARPMEYAGRNQPMTLNVNPKGEVRSDGEMVELEAYVKREARLLKLQLEASNIKLENGELPVPVIIRADKTVQFTLVNNMIRVCQEQGYRQFSLSAMPRAETK